MKKSTLSLITCPDCQKDKLKLTIFKQQGNEIVSGKIDCLTCRNWFYIKDRILDLLPSTLRRINLYLDFAKKHQLSLPKHKKKSRDSHKQSQIKLFEEDTKKYEEQVVNCSFYKALDNLIFRNWIQKKLRPNSLILDLGCGTGRQTIPMAKKGINSIGIDVSEEMVYLALAKIDKLELKTKVDYIITDAENLPFKDNIFDGCVAYGTLHHLPNIPKSLKSISSKLKKGALFLSLDPHQSKLRVLFDLLMKVKKLYDDEGHEDHLITEKKLTTWLALCNIKHQIKFSSYLPPHFFIFSPKTNNKVLQITDNFINKFPLSKKIAGVIIAEGIKD